MNAQKQPQHTPRITRISAMASVLFFIPTLVSAAILSIEPSEGTYGPGDTFVATVRLDPDKEECVNVVEVSLSYPKDWLKASAVSNGESLLTLWPEEPTVDHEKGIVRLSGGIPAGYCGRVQGDPGKTNIIAKIVFSVPGNMIGGKTASGTLPLPVVFGEETAVLLNDGFGTKAPLVTRNAEYVRATESTGTGNEWLAYVHEDKFPPDLFTIALERDPNTFQGKYFIVFSTVDKQSGIHHYEVTEDDPMRFGFVRGKKNDRATPIAATSPYVLTDQTLGSRVMVRAYDHAGNIQEALLAPRGATSTGLALAKEGEESRLWWYVGAGLLLSIAVAGYLIYRRREELEENPTGE